MDFELTWFESRKCWKKYRNGKVHYLGKGKCKGKYDMDGYHAALNEWKLIEGDIIQAEKKKQLEDQLFETDSAKLKAVGAGKSMARRACQSA